MHIRQFTKALVLCVVFGALIIGCNQMRAKVWVEQTDELSFDANGLNKIAVTSHNGPITFTGDSDRSDVQVVVVTKCGGRNEESAAAALDAIEIISESNDGTHTLGYRWSVEKRFDWQSKVSFEVSMPARLMAQARTHNGAVTATGVDGACDLATHNGAVTVANLGSACDIETHNGRVSVDAPQATVSAETHNGAIDAKCGGQNVFLASHNGPIKLDATTLTALNGTVTSHNGAINVTIPKSANAKLSCRTRNGSIHCDAPWTPTKKTRRSVSGVLGDGAGQFKAETHNGSIRIKEAEK